jgi:hypothetical protein
VVYDRLPRDLKSVIDGNSGQAAAGMAGAMWDLQAASVVDMVSARGDPITTLLPEAVAHWRKATAPVIEAWLKEMKERKVDGGKLLASAQALLAKYASEPEPQPAPPAEPTPSQPTPSQPPPQASAAVNPPAANQSAPPASPAVNYSPAPPPKPTPVPKVSVATPTPAATPMVAAPTPPAVAAPSPPVVQAVPPPVVHAAPPPVVHAVPPPVAPPPVAHSAPPAPKVLDIPL